MRSLDFCHSPIDICASAHAGVRGSMREEVSVSERREAREWAGVCGSERE